MHNFKRRFKEDPEFALAVIVTAVPMTALLVTAVSKLIGSSAYAVHAAKRPNHS